MNSSVCVGSRAKVNLKTALFWAITNYQYSLRNSPGEHSSSTSRRKPEKRATVTLVSILGLGPQCLQHVCPFSTDVSPTCYLWRLSSFGGGGGGEGHPALRWAARVSVALRFRTVCLRNDDGLRQSTFA
jgi:hypothetical protein